jgi:hypothetical protein
VLSSQRGGPDGTSIALACGAQLAAPAAAALAVGDQVTLGIRPEHLLLETATGIPAIVFAVERLGEGTYLYAKVEHSGEQIVARADPDRAWQIRSASASCLALRYRACTCSIRRASAAVPDGGVSTGRYSSPGLLISTEMETASAE